MYERYYGFRERPFQLTPDPACMFFGRHHRTGLSGLEYALMQQTPISLITGEIGCGKTTLIRYMLGRADQSVNVGLISNTSSRFDRLLPWVAIAFGLPFRDQDDAALYVDLTEYLIAQYAMGRRTVLVVDEAQNLRPELLEDLRVLSNINADKHVALQIVLVGQPELLGTIGDPSMLQLAQRIGASHHIEPFTVSEARLYVLHRLRVAGGRLNIFSNEAIDLVAEGSGGVPRLINQLCDTALVYGYGEQWSQINSIHMRLVLADKVSGGVFPSVRKVREAAEIGVRRGPARVRSLRAY